MYANICCVDGGRFAYETNVTLASAWGGGEVRRHGVSGRAEVKGQVRGRQEGGGVFTQAVICELIGLV